MLHFFNLSRCHFLLCLVAGLCSVFSFAPFYQSWWMYVCLSVLILCLEYTKTCRKAFLLGFVWALGSFLAGVSWVYISLYEYAQAPLGIALLALLLFSSYLALFMACVAMLYCRYKPKNIYLSALLLASFCCVAEWLRGHLLTGFPWLSIGYSQIPLLNAWFPILGVYGVGFVCVFMSGILSKLVIIRRYYLSLFVLGVFAIVSVLFAQIQWTQPKGKAISVALVQTNFAQSLKWDERLFTHNLQITMDLIKQAAQSNAPNAPRLIALPETSVPFTVRELPIDFAELLKKTVNSGKTDIIMGIFNQDAQGRYYNAALQLTQNTMRFYAKRHLVPFGEYSPPLFHWFYQWLNIPKSNLYQGQKKVQLMPIDDQFIAVNICYEDLFGSEIIDALPQANILLNLSNLAWFGRSLALPQHLQISQARALETGRPMLRATNTGMTALVEPDGRVFDYAPMLTQNILTVPVQGFIGLTPYIRWGDYLIMAIVFLNICGILLFQKKYKR